MAGVKSCTPTGGHGLQLERSVAHRVEIASSPDCSLQLITNPALVPWALLLMLQAALVLVREVMARHSGHGVMAVTAGEKGLQMVGRQRRGQIAKEAEGGHGREGRQGGRGREGRLTGFSVQRRMQ